MNFKKLSLRDRIFIAMIFLVLLASALIAIVASYQYSEETKDYHKQRLERKEKNIKSHLDFVIRETTFPVTTKYLPYIFKTKIYEISDIHGLEVNLYDLEGGVLISSKAAFQSKASTKCISPNVLNAVLNTAEHKFVEKHKQDNEVLQSSYTIITDTKSKPLAILKLPYLEDDKFYKKELFEFLERLGYTYVFMILIAIGIAYLLSNYITRRLKMISNKMNEIRLEKRNKKLDIDTSTVEIAGLIESYNSMIDELEESAVMLAKSEREQAWREMAKQVAHEIKNPLTPMQLTVQSFQRQFNPKDPEIYQKVEEFSKTLIEQIHTMSSIASAFSNFAKMPAQVKETLNVVDVVSLALDIFSEEYISYQPNKHEIIAKFDKTQLIRVVTNLIKNAVQALAEVETPKIIVGVAEKNNMVVITVFDNGSGISEAHKTKIFEPKFTTKSSGMGLGLAMIKKIIETYNGSITFTSKVGKGTTFTVIFPKE